MKEDFGKIAHTTLHTLWTKAVGTDTYVKSEWMELQRAIGRLNQEAEDRNKAA